MRLSFDFPRVLSGLARKVLILKGDICKVFRIKELHSLRSACSLPSGQLLWLTLPGLQAMKIVKDRAQLGASWEAHVEQRISVGWTRNSILPHGVKLSARSMIGTIPLLDRFRGTTSTTRSISGTKLEPAFLEAGFGKGTV